MTVKPYIAISAYALLALSCGKSSGPSKGSVIDASQRSSSPAEPSVSQTEPPSSLDATTPTERDDGDAALHCERQPYPTTIDLAEASGATWMSDGSLLVVGDSGRNGAYLQLHAGDGSVLSSGNLPLDDRASDDLEGLSRIGDTIYGITSSGRMREWKAKGKRFSLTRTSYSIAAKGDTKNACASAHDSNCGPNYEGLCLRPNAPGDGSCVGYVAAKATGKLLCLKQKRDGRLAIAPEHFIEVASPKTLSGCHFDGDRLWFGNNVFAANAVGFVTGHENPNSAVITRLGALGLGFPEAIANGPAGEVYRFSDTAKSPSLLDKYICR